MTSERIKEIQSTTPYPESRSVQQALMQVWNEVQQESNRLEKVVGLQTANSLYPTCDKIFHKNAFNMVEDYLDAGYYDEARNELQTMINILKHDYPDRNESLHYNNDLTRVGKKSSLSN